MKLTAMAALQSGFKKKKNVRTAPQLSLTDTSEDMVSVFVMSHSSGSTEGDNATTLYDGHSQQKVNARSRERNSPGKINPEKQYRHSCLQSCCYFVV